MRLQSKPTRFQRRFAPRNDMKAMERGPGDEVFTNGPAALPADVNHPRGRLFPVLLYSGVI